MKTISTNAQNVIDKVKALREYTTTTGFRTTKSQHELIQSVDGDDLATVILELKK